MFLLTLLGLLSATVSSADDKMDCLTKAVIAVESDGVAAAINTTEIGVSHGIMQIQLDTARDMGFKGKLADLYKPAINKLYATRYIQWLLKWHHGDLLTALDSYNRGIKMTKKFPYKGDWKKHKYVGLVLSELESLCPTYYAELIPTN